MQIEIVVGIVLALVFVVLAAFDVFWPFSIFMALAASAVWWREGVHAFVVLWRPDLIAAYIGVGFVWTFFKWTRLVEQCLRQGDKRPPLWSSHSYDFAAVFFYWPLDAVAYLLSDFVQEAWKFIARVIGQSFTRYAEWRFAGRIQGDNRRAD